MNVNATMGGMFDNVIAGGVVYDHSIEVAIEFS